MNSKFVTNLRRQIEENPLESIVVLTAATAVVIKLMNANTDRNNAKSWKKEVERRTMMAR